MTIIVTTTGSNASRDYAWLRSSIAGWLHRDDLTAMIPDFVMLAEKRINGDLEARLQDEVTTLAAVNGQRTVNLPDSVADIRSLSIGEFGPLEYVTPDTLEKTYPTGYNGLPRAFTVIGGQIYLGPTPDAAYSLQCVFRAHVPPLADTASGINWLIRDYPTVYLAASLLEGFSYIGNQARLAEWEKKYADAIASVNKTDWYSGSTMRVRSDVRF